MFFTLRQKQVNLSVRIFYMGVQREMGVYNWRAAGELMYFEQLDRTAGILVVYSIGWRIEDKGDDVWTRRFIQFKYNGNPYLICGAQILKEATSELIGLESFEPSKTALTTALSSSKTEADKSSNLFRSGKWIAGELGLQWQPDLFTKRAHKPLHSLTSWSDRDDEVGGAYTYHPADGFENLIIIDDFVTRGSTLSEMVTSARTAGCTSKIVGLVLGKNERQAYAADYGVVVNNDHIGQKWDDVWTATYNKATGK